MRNIENTRAKYGTCFLCVGMAARSGNIHHIHHLNPMSPAVTNRLLLRTQGFAKL